MRLVEFILFRLGASTRYTEMRGHPRLKGRHAPFRIGVAERDRWLELMFSAMDEAALPDAACVFLRAMFSQIADFMRNQPDSGNSAGFRITPLPSLRKLD
jgi:hemoglobin